MLGRMHVLALLAITGSCLGSADAKVAVGEPVPEFSIATSGGKGLRISDLHGKKVLLFFWASW